MKIGLITDSLDYRAAGIGRYIKNLVKTLITVDTRNEYVLIHEKDIDDELYRGNIRQIIIKPPRILFGREFRKIGLGRSLQKFKFDVVHDLGQVGPFFFSNPYATVETIYDLSPILFPQFVTTINRWRNRIGIRQILNKVNAIITISETSKREILEKYRFRAENIHVTPLAHDSEQFHPIALDSNENIDFYKRYQIDTPYLLFVGTIEPRKNITTLVTAYNLLRARGSMVKLFIVGKLGWKYHEIQKSIALSPYAKDIHWIASVEDGDLPLFYANARALVFPSWHEGFGLPLVEAMACQCPIVCSDIAIMHEVAGSAAIYFDPHRPEQCTDAMGVVLQDSEKRIGLINAGNLEVGKYSWEKCALKTMEVYEQFKK